jgi:putative glutamine amidotransferase
MRFNKPFIGITLSQALKAKHHRWPLVWEFDYLNKAYHYAVEKSGGIPVGLFSTRDKSIIGRYLDLLDGVIFTGGTDINAKYFRQKRHPSCTKFVEPRDSFELELIKKALKRKLPIMCICRGHQLLNIALGGDLNQDIKLLGRKTLKHDQVKSGIDSNHRIYLNKQSILYRILKKDSILVNSSHHQIINNLGKNLRIVATSADGVIEALEMQGYPFLLSIQWHPERIFRRSHSRNLFSCFVDIARANK